MRKRPAAAAAVAMTAAVLSPLTATPAAAEITSGYFDCSPVGIQVTAPSYTFRGVASDPTVWWVPQYYKWNGTEMVLDSTGEYHYNREAGAPHAWYRYPAGDQGGNQGLSRADGYYAVVHWVYAEGQWHWYWAQNADPGTGTQPEGSWWCTA